MIVHLLIILFHFSFASQARRYVRRLSRESLSPSASWTTFPTPDKLSQSPSASLKSSGPSSSPTSECHDLADYKSPINDLPCWAFRNTDCLAWKYIGLTDLQLLELLQSCPQSCEVDCSISSNPTISPSVSYRTLFTDVEFYIYGAHDILDSNAKVVLEEVVINFVSNTFTDESSAIVSFTIDNQQIIYDHELRKRNLSGATLLINGKIVFRTIDETVTSNSLKLLISNMIDSSTFQERLNDETILSELVVSSSLRIDVGGSPDIGTTKDTSPTKKALTISTIVAVLCSVVLLVGFMYKKQKQLKYSKQLSPDNKLKQMYNDSEGSLWEDATQPHHNNISKVDSEDQQESFNSKLLERSNSAEEMEINLHLFPKSPTRLKSEPESVIPHIPSMIIFDNIDDENNMSPSEGSRSSTNSREKYASKKSLKVTPVTMGMPVKRVDASSELMEILSSKKIQNPNQAYSLLT